MSVIDSLYALLDNKIFMYSVSAIGGGVLVYLRNGLRTLEYTVSHQGLAFSSNDPIIGSIQVSWRSTQVTNLYLSKVELKNNTNKDFKNITFKTYTLDTLLLTEKTEIVGTSQIAKWSPAFQQTLAVPPNGTPTPSQFDIYNKSREYQVPVFNRRQKIILTYLTTIPQTSPGPAIWLETIHEGVLAKYKPPGPEIFGVSIKIATNLGVLLATATVMLSILYLSDLWLSSLICMLVGLFAKPLGATLYQIYKLIKSIIIR